MCMCVYCKAMEHSKNMAERKVPFGHEGFKVRCQQISFKHKSSAENVAWCTDNTPNIPRVLNTK